MSYYIVRFLVNAYIYLLNWPKVTGKKKIPKKGPFIIYANHKSLFDPFFVSSVVKPKIHFMAKIELFKMKIFASLLRSWGAFPVDRKGPALSAVKTALRILKRGDIFGIFPEGTRIKTKQLGEMSPGAAAIALKSKVKVIPIVIKGSYKPFCRVNMRVGDPLDLSEFQNMKSKQEAIDAASDAMSKAMTDLLEG